VRFGSGDRRYIEDRRGAVLTRGLPLGVGGIVVLALLSWATGTDFLSLLAPGAEQETPQAGESTSVQSTPQEERLKDLAGAVMTDVNTTWSQLLPGRYQPTTLVLFRDQVNAEGCGLAESASGPFYCPGARKVFIDLGFYQELDDRFGAPGDFAQAYVLAHEVGHHVQTLLGIEERVRAAQQQRPSAANTLSVSMELQADCLAGVWGHEASRQGRYATEHKVELDPGDIDEGLRAAAAIGDDRLQRMTSGHVVPEKFTHGTSAQRTEWFRRGFDTGKLDACDTFGTGTR
jgi:uncharacterized protein